MTSTADASTTDGVKGRSEVDHLVCVDVDAALRRARKIGHPWYRCQALSAVAAAQRSSKVALRIVDELFSAAYEQSEPNRIVSVASWPLRQLVMIDPQGAGAAVVKLLGTIATEAHGLRRLDGISRIVGAVAGNPALLDLVKPAFMTTARSSAGWRTERIVSLVAANLAQDDKEFALSLLLSRQANRFRDRVLRHLDAAGGQNPA